MTFGFSHDQIPPDRNMKEMIMRSSILGNVVEGMLMTVGDEIVWCHPDTLAVLEDQIQKAVSESGFNSNCGSIMVR